ncbi:MAG: hypothetical protein ACREVH_13065 [Gammaproteobacteria bacterium]
MRCCWLWVVIYAVIELYLGATLAVLSVFILEDFLLAREQSV